MRIGSWATDPIASFERGGGRVTQASCGRSPPARGVDDPLVEAHRLMMIQHQSNAFNAIAESFRLAQNHAPRSSEERDLYASAIIAGRVGDRGSKTSNA
jgi:hypothetical protein